MRVINKKIVIIPIFLIVLFCLLIGFKIELKNKNDELDEVKLVNNEVKNKGFAIMVEDVNGTYSESISDSWPTNMIYNSELSGCVDLKGNKIENALTYDSVNNIVTVETGSTSYCYLYFDKNTSNVFYKLEYDYANNNGVNLLSETSNEAYPVYYYTGNVLNNNIIYADLCWKMVRTTDTGGVKLIYNGVITDGSCNNTGSATTIDTNYTMFNPNYNSPAYVGYMYNKVYTFDEVSLDETYIYGKSVTWNGTNYTINDTITGYSNGLNNAHYSCYSTSNICNEVYYIYYVNDSTSFRITLTGGKTVEDALNEMLYNEDVNTTNSTIKSKIDSWYESNIKDLSDNNGKLYSDYLENTIYCNNREMSNASTNGWNPNGGNTETIMYFRYNALECDNKTDQFTLKESAGGTAGYGNNTLDYPIGLLTAYEAILAGAIMFSENSNSNYLNNDNCWFWLLSPYSFFNYHASGWVLRLGNLKNNYVYSAYGVRPVISLSKKVKIKENVGNGTVDSPYELSVN